MAATTAERYRRFATVEARGSSPSYERLALGVAADQELLTRLERLPPAKRQPNLLLAAVRWLGGPSGDWPAFRSMALGRWDEVAAAMAARSTQTNEAGRCGVLLPVLAQLPQPLALIEIGAAAGLCLQPDRYHYRYRRAGAAGMVTTTELGRSPVTIEVACSGPVPLPTRLPSITWRAGLDLQPLDVGSPDDLAWLRACIWPEHQARLARLDAAAALAAADPPRIVCGDLTTDGIVDRLLSEVPTTAATTVLFHSAVLAYVPPDARRRFAARLRERSDVVWLANEAPSILDGVTAPAPVPATAPSAAHFVVAVDGRAVATADHHGSWLSWPEAP